MNTADLDKYYQDTFSLVRTMVIKIEEVAKRDNLMLSKAGYSVSNDKETWRYYMNLNGEYHQTDDVMIVQSIDTGEEIVFNKANLDYHTLTKREYIRGDYWYSRLVKDYPHQSTLINGIISPIPYSETIGAADYKILRYNKNLVLWNEDQLIFKLQKYVNSISNSLFETEYLFTDNLFLPLMVQKLYADLIQAVLTIRIEDVYTRHTHEFFVWSHINSFGDFDKYKRVLTKEQTMWLFRNIAWISNNPGQQHTFDKLLYNLLTVAGIPLSKYDMVETTSTQLEDLKPTPLYRRLPLNLSEVYGREPDFFLTKTVILKEQREARGNFEQTAFYFKDALVKGENSLHSELPTKVLESVMLDYTNKHNDTLMSTVINEWAYLSSKGFLKNNILVSNPKNGDQIRISQEDAFNLWIYLIGLSNGRDPVLICPIYFDRVLKCHLPSFEEVQDAGGVYFVSDKLTADIRDRWFEPGDFLNPPDLIEYSTRVYWLAWEYKKMYSHHYDLNKRARVKGAASRMFTSGYAKLGTHKYHHELLAEYNISLLDYTSEELKALAWEVFVKSTGWDDDLQPSTSSKQSALIELMMRLSSYTIHTVKSIDDGVETIELPNEILVGEVEFGGDGSFLESDFSNVMIKTKTNLNNLSKMQNYVKPPKHDDIKALTTSSGKANIITNEVLNHYDLRPTLNDWSTKFHSNGYIHLLPPGQLKRVT